MKNLPFFKLFRIYPEVEPRGIIRLKIKLADKITHYWARHTFATTLKRSGISIAIISEALGHSSESMTKAYLDKFEQTEMDSTFKHLI